MVAGAGFDTVADFCVTIQALQAATSTEVMTGSALSGAFERLMRAGERTRRYLGTHQRSKKEQQCRCSHPERDRTHPVEL